VLLLVIAIPALAAAPKPKSSSHPPRELHRVGDHWTAYNPPDPTSYPATAKTYPIKRGDTLWALAQQFYGNAYLWPQLWESNTWITDAHWIYPGDVLLVEGEASSANVTTSTTTTQVASSSSDTANDQGSAVADVTPASTPVALATEADLYCYGYIGDPNEPMPIRIESFEDVELFYQANVVSQSQSVAAGEIVYVAGGTSTGITAGETYLVVHPDNVVKHPAKAGIVGRQYLYVGQIRILCAEETRSRAIITQSCREIEMGDRLKPIPQLPIPIARIPALPEVCNTPTDRSNGYIVASKGFDEALGVGDLVQIDLGHDDQLQPGDFMTVFRDTHVAGQPRQILGELGILTTESHTATARVVAMRKSMTIGDRVEAR
jgi:LysM repeat protein